MINFIKNNYIKLLFLTMFIVGVIYYNHSANGICKAAPDGRLINHTDEEFIRFALNRINYQELAHKEGHLRVKQLEDDTLAEKMTVERLSKYPNCCKVFRKKDWSESYVSQVGVDYWWDSVLVKVYSDKVSQMLNQGKEPSYIDEFNELTYYRVDNCLKNSGYMYQIMPGG